MPPLQLQASSALLCLKNWKREKKFKKNHPITKKKKKKQFLFKTWYKKQIPYKYICVMNSVSWNTWDLACFTLQASRVSKVHDIVTIQNDWINYWFIFKPTLRGLFSDWLFSENWVMFWYIHSIIINNPPNHPHWYRTTVMETENHPLITLVWYRVEKKSEPRSV